MEQNINRSFQIDPLIKKVSKYTTFQLMIFVFLLDITVSCIFSFILFPNEPNEKYFSSIKKEFLLIVLIGPIIETFVFQYFIIKSSLKYINNNKLIAILVSSLLFGLSHYYSIPYIIKASLAGFLYSMLYFALTEKGKSPFVYIFLVHSFYNLIGFTINHL